MTNIPQQIALKSLDHRARVVAGLYTPGPDQIRTWPYPDASEILTVFQDYIDLRKAVSDAVMDIEIGGKRPQSVASSLNRALEKGEQG